jgi:hypothetical protein
MTPFTRLLAAALAAGALAAGADAARAAAPPPPIGDAAGIELAAKVNAYYSAKPRMGVAFRTRVGGVAVTTRMVLVRGKVGDVISVATKGKTRVTTAVTSRGVFVKGPGERCWTKLGPGSGAEEYMVPMKGSRFLAPESIGALTRLEVSLRDPASRARTRIVFKVDAATGRIATMINAGLVMNLRTLPRAPAVPGFRPVCRA